MALRRTLEMLKLGEKINDELYRSTVSRPKLLDARWRFVSADELRRLRAIRAPHALQPSTSRVGI